MANGQSSSKEEPNPEKLFEEEIKKPYYTVDYLNNFKLPYEKLDVSVVIPTYNRSPYSPNSLKRELNPLSWAIKSILLQKPSVNELIIVDDHSSDKTKQVVDSFREEALKKGVKISYIKNKKHLGYGISINVAGTNANSKYLFFVDDDSIMAPYAAFGAVYTFEWLLSQGVNVGIINLPPYLRSSIPENTLSKKQISQIDFYKGIYLSNKASFPEEYLEDKNKFIHEEFHILKPFTIQNSGGYFLCSKKVFNEIGGFPVTIYKRFPEREFGCMAIDNGYLVYFQADPKFHCVHGSYGLKNNRTFKGDDWFRRVGGDISLKKTMEFCNRNINDTGCRIDQKEFIYNSLVAIFSILYPRNSKGAIKWVKKVYDDFVIGGKTEMLNTSLKEPLAESERKEIWDRAIKEGLEFIRKRELSKIKRIQKVKDNLKGKEITPEMLNILTEPEPL